MTRTTLLLLTAMAGAMMPQISQASLADAVGQVPPAIKSRGGFCVMVGDPGQIEVAQELSAAGPWVIHWLAPQGSNLDEARQRLEKEGVYGKISIEAWDADRLPHTDNLANLILVDAKPDRFSEEELLRALAPQGVAVITGDEGKRTLVKERPASMGEWTHPWQSSNGNLVGQDTYLDVPNGFQWLTSPGFPMGTRKSSTPAIVSSGGRTFFITHNVPENLPSTSGKSGVKPAGDFLLARDSFNGVQLWAVPWEGPSKRHSQGANDAIVATPERLFASSNKGVAVLDTTNGKQLALWKTESTPGKLLLEDGVLIAETNEGLIAFDAESGKTKWSHKLAEPNSSLLHEGKVFVMIEMRETDGRWLQQLLAIDAGSGKELWRQPVESPRGRRDTADIRLHFAAAGVLCLVDRTNLRFLSLEDGTQLWSHESKAEARGGMDSRQVGHFLANDLIWIRNERASGGREASETWLAVQPKTGKKVRELTVTGPQGVDFNVNKVGCQPHAATERFVLDPRLATIWDFEGGQRAGFKFARGACQVGIVPANGLAYIAPNACGCLHHQIRGFLAIGNSTDPGLTSVLPSEVEKGPAFGKALPEGFTDAPWPTYRADERRSGAIAGELGGTLKPAWSTKIELTKNDLDPEWKLHFGRPVTPPVIAGGMVFLAKPQSHLVLALDEATGEEKWRFTAGGRVLTPPTIHQGIALVGSSDGFVYALRADDGELIWRRRAAPSDRRIMAYGQLESAWPVAGGVLVKDGVALVGAGRAADADGGMVVHAMDPATGEIHWTQRIDEPIYGVQEPLISDGTAVYLVGKKIDPKTGKVSSADEKDRYLRSGKVGMLENSWTGIELALRKQHSEWSLGEARGQILSANGNKAYSFLLEAGEVNSPSTEGGGMLEARVVTSENPTWQLEIPKPAQVEAMVASENKLVVAGSNDRFQSEKKGFLAAIDGKEGKETARVELSAAPVFDGLAAADGSLFAVLQDGTVVRFNTN